MVLIHVQKMNIVKEIDERDFKEWQEKGYKKVETDKLYDQLFDEQPKKNKFDNMPDEELAAYAEHIGVDISRVKSREAAIAKLEKAEQGAG